MSIVENIKKAAITSALSRAASNEIWEARQALEDANKECFDNFDDCMADCRQHMSNAEELYREFRKALSE